jgi:hypothetical protein
MQGNISQSKTTSQVIKPLFGLFAKQAPASQKPSKIPNLQKPIVQPIKYIQHFPVFKKRRYKAIKFLDLKVSPSVKFQKVKRVLKHVKYIAKARFEYGPQKNFESLYSVFSSKIFALEVDKLISLPPLQKDLIIRRLREFKHATSLSVANVKPENEKYGRKEINHFQYSIQSLRELQAISFKGERNLVFLSEGMTKIFPYLKKVKKIEGPIEGLVLKYFYQFSKCVQKLENLQEFKFEIAESTLNNPFVLSQLKNWMASLTFARKLILVVTGTEFKADLTALNEIEVLEIIYELSENLPSLANHVESVESMLLPVSFDWKISPRDTHDQQTTAALIHRLSKLKNVKKIYQSYNFEDEHSVFKGCYPIWKDVVSYYNFQMLEILNLGVFLSDDSVDKFQNVFIESLRSMHRLRVLGVTLHNEGSTNKRFHLTGPILDLPRVIATLPCLDEFEFNTEIEISLNILTEFFRGLTQVRNIRKFKSEWLQISQNSFKAFAKRLGQMKNLELLDIHLYSLYDIPKKELDSVFSALGDSLEKMPNLKNLQITGDNECFSDEGIWQEWQDKLRARCGKKSIELTLAETE